jgi:hypothetical protein
MIDLNRELEMLHPDLSELDQHQSPTTTQNAKDLERSEIKAD